MNFAGLMKACTAGALSMAAAAALAGAVAMPLPQSATIVTAPAASEAEAPVVLAHGCHRGIQRDYSGWHFHTGACVRRNTAPPGLYDNSAYRRYYRTPTCRYQCRFVGPVKTCQQVCR